MSRTAKHVALLRRMGSCDEAVAFAAGFGSLHAAWDACPRPDWMLWLLGRIGHQDDRAYRLYACWCVRNTPIAGGRTVWDLLTDERSKTAVIVAERFAEGQATQEDLDAARDAAWAAARAAAWDAARDGAWAAARDAAWDAAWDAARDAARDAAWDAQAKKLREHLPWEAVEVAIEAFMSKSEVEA